MQENDIIRLFSALKPLVHDAQKYDALVAYIDFEIAMEQKTLESLTDLPEVYRSQGKIKSLRKLRKLRDYILSSEKG
jgi:hypothetical protein